MPLFRTILTFILFLIWAAPIAFAQDAIEANSTEAVDDERFRNAIHIQNLSFNIEEVGRIYQITVEAELLNRADEATEAEFMMPMPKGAIINDYALDIDGQLVSGVLTEKERAEKTYTDKVTRNVDPGIAELTIDNRYKTRIFPVEPGKTRTIRLGFAVDANDELSWQVLTEASVGAVSFSGNAVSSRLADNPSYTETEGVFKASDILVDANFSYELRGNPVEPFIAKHPLAGKFLITDLTKQEIEKLTSSATFNPNSIAILWDKSLSRAGDNHSAELSIIQSFLEESDPSEIRLIMGSDHIEFDKSFERGVLNNQFDDIHYDGGSDLNALLDFKGRYDMCILVSDGHSTIGRGKIEMPDCPVYIVSGATTPNTAYFNALAANSGGHLVHDISSRQNALSQLSAAPKIAIIKSNLENPKLVGPYHLWGTIIAPLGRQTGTAEFILQNAESDKVLIKRDLSDLEVVENAAPGTIWASLETENLRAKGKSVAEIIDFSRPYSIAGKESALIVLEDPEDYVVADIPPPANYPEELMEEYEEELAYVNEERADDYEYRHEELVEIWDEQIEWWETKYKYEAKKEKSQEEDNVQNVVVMGAPSPMTAPPPPQVETREAIVEQSGSQEMMADTGFVENDLDEIMVSGTSISRNRVSIEIREWTPDRPYLKAISNADNKERHSIYTAQQAQYGDLPAFYLEMADYYNSMDDQTRAGQILLGALELPAANTETYTQVAHRLLAYGQYDRAIELYRYVAEIAPNLPQSYLNLAIALHDRGLDSRSRKAQKDFAEAVSLLETAILTPWLFEDTGDYEGIEIVAMMEANAIIPRLDDNNFKDITYPEELIRNLDVDQRVVMDWNVDHADLDLWIEEPTGEEASYSFQLTGIGGQLSNDMTDGYGPEQYLLRRAIKGDYEIRTDFFSESEYNPNGAVTVRVRITKDFGRRDQSTETIIVELQDADDEITVGSFKVE